MKGLKLTLPLAWIQLNKIVWALDFGNWYLELVFEKLSKNRLGWWLKRLSRVFALKSRSLPFRARILSCFFKLKVRTALSLNFRDFYHLLARVAFAWLDGQALVTYPLLSFPYDL